MEWKEYKMKDLIEEISMGPFGSDVKKEFYVESGIPILNGSNLQGFKLQEESFGYLTKEKADSLKKSNASRGDIIVTHRGTLGQIVYVPEDSKYDRYVISQSQFRFRCNKDLVDTPYLVYYFHSRIGQHKILANASQVGVPALARASSTFREIEIKLPDLATQRRISSILSSLDRKIELNNKINATLEEMAQALFKSWFVDFDPFKNGNFIDTEIGKIPEGWRVAELGEFMPIKTGKKDANVASTNGTYPFFSCSQGISWTNDYSFEGCAILVAGNGDFNVKWYKGKFEAYQRTYVLIPYEEKLTHLLFYAIKFYLKQITQGARGSVIKFITKGNLQNFKIACPQDIANHEIATRFCAINEQIRVNSQQSLTLTHLRDTLLPRLMSGEIEV